MFQTEFVCEYKKDKSYFTTKINEDCNYIIVKKCEDESIGVLYLVKKDNYFVPMSNRTYPNQESAIESLKEILIGQEITLLTGINTYNVENDYKQSYTLSINSKTDKINNIYNYKNKLNCFVDITNDYQYTLDKLSNNRQERYVNNNIINSIVESIASNQMIDRNIYEDSVLLTIIDAWNDNICKNPNINNGANERKYTDVLKDLIAVKTLAESLTKENNELQTKVTSLEEENELLKKDAEEKDEKIQKVFELVKPRN